MKVPNLKTWAEAIVYIAREGTPAPDRILKAVEDELRAIARKYQDIGDRDGWWQAIEDDKNYQKMIQDQERYDDLQKQ